MYITKPVWSHGFGLECLDFQESSDIHLESLSPDYIYLHAKQTPHLSFPSQTIPDCIRYIIGVFWYSFKLQMNILASY